ncbi:MAG: tetratricopeptide repeat protein [Cyanomargarita calcarea GSE-NOS-MK-12-04C]|uniref:Tetratricopeptide repeat protein n=1 Tax=Cyanomargarita calcarea GSE-NOS-MK-12-04C TaxID=2839659 RepID=A0A951URM9_9CYAN|nr:tetratricopeptide repeat protein [Cyanomargarita calcarea GSE-NOS-MK-12-04C]
MAAILLGTIGTMPVASLPALVAQSSPDRQKAEADRLYWQGVHQTGRGDFKPALQSWQEALAIYRQIQDREGEENALDNLGTASMILEDYPKAIDYFQQELAIAREIKDRSMEERALDRLKSVYRIQNSPTSKGKIADHLLFDQGEEQYRNSQVEAALESWQQALTLYHEIGNPYRETEALSRLVDAYRFLGNYAKAIEYGQQSLAIVQKHSNDSLAQILSNAVTPKSLELIKERVLINLGDNYFALGNYAKAIEYYHSGLVIAQRLQSPLGTWTLLNKVGRVYYALGDYAKAIDYQQQSLAAWQTINDSVREQGRGQALGDLGRVYYALGDYAKAIAYQQQSLAIARTVKDRRAEGQSLGNLGLAYLNQGDYAKAIDYQQQWLAIARQIKDRESEGAALNNLGYALYKKGNLALAEKTLLEGITVLESLRGKLEDINKVSIFDTQRNTYNSLQQVLIAQNKTDAALEIAERGRARAFVELLVSRSNFQLQPKASTIEEIKQIAQTHSSMLVQYSIIYDDFKIQDKPKYQESELYIWVIKPTGEVTFRKADLKPLWQKENISLADLVTTSRDSIGARGRSAIDVSYNPSSPKATSKLKRLHELLINPIADLLPKNPDDKVIFIPQESLFLVPFAALQDANDKYLIEKYTILTAPSIQVLDLTHKQRSHVLNRLTSLPASPYKFLSNITSPF